MTDKQPEALRQAAWLKKEGASCQRHYDLGVLIERQHAELETLREKLKTYEDLGNARSDMQLLRMGYAAARLEIESLKSQLAEHASHGQAPAQAAPAAAAGAKKWAPEEVEDGERGIRWVTNEGIHGRPTDHDVREYLKRTPTANGCLCDECKVFYAAAPTTQPSPVAQGDALDAARYRWLREWSSTMFVKISINGDGAEIAETLDSAVDAARKQGGAT